MLLAVTVDIRRSPVDLSGADGIGGFFRILITISVRRCIALSPFSGGLHGSNALSRKFLNKNTSDLALAVPEYTPPASACSGGFPLLHNFLRRGGSPPWLRSLGRFRDGGASFPFVERFGYQFASWWDLIVLQPLQVPAIGVEIACAQSGCFSLLVKLS